MIRLGQKARDMHTGFEGVCTATIDYLGGDNQVRIEKLADDGGVKSEWFPEGRVEPVVVD